MIHIVTNTNLSKLYAEDWLNTNQEWGNKFQLMQMDVKSDSFT